MLKGTTEPARSTDCPTICPTDGGAPQHSLDADGGGGGGWSVGGDVDVDFEECCGWGRGRSTAFTGSVGGGRS
jgi:hypothetical protein